MANYAIALEYQNCIDCRACEVACKDENGVMLGADKQRIWVGADPRDESVKDRLNVTLRRDVFQPFAPSMLWEKAGEYLEDLNGRPNEFMTMSYKASEEFRKTAPAVVHVDRTTRPQAVRKEINELYYSIITEFNKKTGVGAVLNTSFNMHGEPIVCSPGDALRTFREAKLDFLIMGNFAVSR
jgi:carbamoyltransferase